MRMLTMLNCRLYRSRGHSQSYVKGWRGCTGVGQSDYNYFWNIIFHKVV